jgi:hypothetical protein
MVRVVAFTILALALLSSHVLTQAGPGSNRGQGESNRADPCALAPSARGEAKGIEKRCGLGGSGGVGRGDFNNDGIADLAVGVPDEARQSTVFDRDCFCFRVTNHPGAGTVNIIYGGANGLTPTGSQVLGDSSLAIDTDAHFGKALAAGRFRGPGFSL